MSGKCFAVGLIGAAVLVQGCAGPPEPPPAPPLFAWSGVPAQGPVRMVINLTTQRADVFVGGQHAGWAVVATGKEGFGTPAGNYTITEKVVDKYSTFYGKTVDGLGNTVNPDADVRKDKPPPGGKFIYAPMPYWMRLTRWGIGMHAGVIPQPGTPASHGCIRLPEVFAAQLFERVKIGTPVRIVR